MIHLHGSEGSAKNRMRCEDLKSRYVWGIRGADFHHLATKLYITVLVDPREKTQRVDGEVELWTRAYKHAALGLRASVQRELYRDQVRLEKKHKN